MRTMAVTAYGEPLESGEAPEPEPGPGQVLLRVLTCGVCFTDVKIARGRMPFSADLRLPHVPGHEVFGKVVSSNPPGLVEPGTAAIVYQYWPCGRCAACRRRDDVQCTHLTGWLGFAQDGGFRELVVVPADRLIPVPPSIDPVEAAPMSCAIGTAYRAVSTRGEVGPGSRVAVIGLGGVGIHAAQIAEAAGGRVAGFDIHEPTLRTARELGLEAHHAEDERAVARLTARSDAGQDVVIDTVGVASSLAQADRLVRPGGRIVMVGYTSESAVTLPTTRVVLNEIDVRGSRYASRAEMGRGVAMVEAGLVRPVVGLVRTLAGANEALDALESGDVVGRAVLDVAGVG
jgi:2-desacetyl-2-hydroxyethyl bacteriochlorophyllide A dehydrogenase